ncbi:MAG: hypothetical protein P8Y45_11080 [Exilibacterium sp.]
MSIRMRRSFSPAHSSLMGMRLLLISVAQRLASHGGDPVIQLQTAFGGGKTHTLLAVYHLASRTVGTEQLHGIPPVITTAIPDRDW